jgi:hypothetical protein
MTTSEEIPFDPLCEMKRSKQQKKTFNLLRKKRHKLYIEMMRRRKESGKKRSAYVNAKEECTYNTKPFIFDEALKFIFKFENSETIFRVFQSAEKKRVDVQLFEHISCNPNTFIVVVVVAVAIASLFTHILSKKNKSQLKM